MANTKDDADVYSASKEEAWRCIVEHEKRLQRIWKFNWREMLDYIQRREEVAHNMDVVRNSMKLKNCSRNWPVTSSGFIGWKASDRKNHYNEYHTQMEKRPPKIRFQKQLYGYYEKQKYLVSEQNQQNKEEVLVPTKKITHFVKPLIR